MTKRGTLLVLSATVPVLLTLPASGPAASSRCAASRSTTLLQNPQLRVFKQPTRDGRRGFDVFACLKATGEGNALGDARSHDYPFLYPAMNLAGPVIAYADEGCDREFCGTTVTATDMRHPHDVHGVVNGSLGAPRPNQLVKVGSLRVSRGGTLVWIACPERRRTKLTGSRKPNCVRPGDRDTVYLRIRGRPLERLDHGRTIDPSSLRLRSGRASWLHGHHRRHAAVD